MRVIITILLAVLLALAWYYSPTLFGAVAFILLLACLLAANPEEVDEEEEAAEMREWVQEEVRAALFKSLRKHKAKYIENALSAYQELYGKDEFYQNIWTKVYEEFYKDSGQS